MSLRAALVDDLLTVSGITDIVDNRITDMNYEYEDYLNSQANAVSKFPAIYIENDGNDFENNLDGHDELKLASYTIVCMQTINLSKRRSRSSTTRNKERDRLRIVDDLAQIVADYLKDKREIISNVAGQSYKLRQPNIEAITDDVASSDDNREVITREIIYSIVYSIET